MSLKKNKAIYLILISGIFLSIIYAIFSLEKFDKNENVNNHLMIRGDTNLIWREAESFKRDIIKNNSIFGSGMEYTRTYLPSKILAFYSIAMNYDLYEDFDNEVIKLDGKLPFLLFQILFYYLSLFFLYKNFLRFYENKILICFIISFLALDPNIIQWHSTFWTESIFFSLQLILMSMIINEKKSYINFLIIGILLGVCFLQKTVAIFFIIFFIIFLIFDEKDKRKLKNLMMLSGFIIVLSFLTFDNFKKTGIAYIMPTQTKFAHYFYIAKRIITENEGNTARLKNEEERWKIENQYNEDSFKSNYEYYNFLQSQATQVMSDNKIKTIKIYVRNTLSHFILNPLQTYYWHKYNQLKFQEVEFHLSDENKNYFFIKIFYSILFYSIILIGIYSVFKNRNKLKFHLLILGLIMYLVVMLGWVGNSRYFMPSIIFLSIFFGHGLNFLYEIKKIKNYLK